MSSEGNFLTYCVEQYKYDKNLTGRQTMALFERYEVLEYIYSCCEPLSDGRSYITEDIDLYIEACDKTDISPVLLQKKQNNGKKEEDRNWADTTREAEKEAPELAEPQMLPA
ncbi:MAG: DUF3791 domain-containing protein [Lachnospiraceae bacterium]|nr:DUF3791 domain-containing protein [Lachnospiraceae bacterium]